MNTEPMTIPEIDLEYISGGQRADPPPYDGTKPAGLGGGIGGYASAMQPNGTLGGERGGDSSPHAPNGK